MEGEKRMVEVYPPKTSPDKESKTKEVTDQKVESKGVVKKGMSMMKKLLLVVVVLLLLAVVLLGVGAYSGLKYYPKLIDWLGDRGVNIETEERGQETIKVDDLDGDEKTITVTSEESAIINVVQNSKDSVVSIAVSQSVATSGDGIRDQASNIGSGFIVDKNGLVVTNQHVVSDPDLKYVVITHGGDEYAVTTILRDPVNDIALLKVEGGDLKPVKLGDSDNIVPGQLVIAIGTPLGDFAGSVTTGVISGLNRSVTTGSSSFFEQGKLFEDVIQTDAAINPGNSGGPLLNSSGEVIGINFATTSSADNISFALPINRVKLRIDEYRKFGKFLRPYVGVEYEMISPATARYFDDLVAGAYVVSVVADSPAAKGGILKEDIITEINGEQVSKSFALVVQQYKVGDQLDMKVYRDGGYINLKVTLGEAPN